MKKVVDDERLIFKCCKLYYEEYLSQKEIADEIGISRVSVSRMLQKGRDMGIVQIQIISPNNLSYSQLERDLEQQFGIKEAIVIDEGPLSTSHEQLSAFRLATINLLENYLQEGDVVGVSMGSTLHNVCAGTRQSTKNINCTFVPLMGGISSVRKATADIHSNYIAHGFAQLFGGEYREFLAPAVFNNADVLRGFMKEDAMQQILACYKELKTVIMGIGTPNRVASTLMKAGYVTQKDMEQMVEQGMVGDISLQFFDINGDTEKFKYFNDRVSGFPLEKLRDVENKICIGGGEYKARSIYGALKGGFVNILITDHECAKRLLAMDRGE